MSHHLNTTLSSSLAVADTTGTDLPSGEPWKGGTATIAVLSAPHLLAWVRARGTAHPQSNEPSAAAQGKESPALPKWPGAVKEWICCHQSSACRAFSPVLSLGSSGK